jgi:hypothetical protein
MRDLRRKVVRTTLMQAKVGEARGHGRERVANVLFLEVIPCG